MIELKKKIIDKYERGVSVFDYLCSPKGKGQNQGH